MNVVSILLIELMYILLSDETNKNPSKSVKFFVYGGICFPIKLLSGLNNKIDVIRKSAGYKPDDSLKFSPSNRPKTISSKQHADAKNAIIELCLENDVKFFVYIIHHDIIVGQDENKVASESAKYVIGRFNIFLNNKDIKQDGICLIDNLPPDIQYKFFAELFQKGLNIPKYGGGTKWVKLNRIQLYGATCLKASHANSAADIILGAFRYGINDPSNKKVAGKMMKNIVKMIYLPTYASSFRDALNDSSSGFIVRPKALEIAKGCYSAFQKDYEDLYEQIDSLVESSSF